MTARDDGWNTGNFARRRACLIDEQQSSPALRDEKDSLARATFNSLLAKLKAKADIDVKASVYGESGEG